MVGTGSGGWCGVRVFVCVLKPFHQYSIIMTCYM